MSDSGSLKSRRAFLGTTALAGVAATLPRGAVAKPVAKYGDSSFTYEVTRTDDEWRARLTEKEFEILREGGTEFPTTHPLWDDYSEGEFYCRGCDLHLYSSEWRAPVKQGWVFFYHSKIDAVLPGLDTGTPYGGDSSVMGSPQNPHRTLIEVHCRRCGSHLGHIVHTGGKLVHCINGTSLRRDPELAPT